MIVIWHHHNVHTSIRAKQVTSHYLTQWWPSLLMHLCVILPWVNLIKMYESSPSGVALSMLPPAVDSKKCPWDSEIVDFKTCSNSSETIPSYLAFTMLPVHSDIFWSLLHSKWYLCTSARFKYLSCTHVTSIQNKWRFFLRKYNLVQKLHTKSISGRVCNVVNCTNDHSWIF